MDNPTRFELIYSLCLKFEWNRTYASEIVNMLQVSEKIEFEPPKGTIPSDDFLLRFYGGDPVVTRQIIKNLSDEEKLECKAIADHMNSKEVMDHEFEVYYFLKSLNEWLRAKGLEFTPEHFVSMYEIRMRKQPELYKSENLTALNEIPHDKKNRIVTDKEEREALYVAFRQKWIDEYPVDAENPHSLI